MIFEYVKDTVFITESHISLNAKSEKMVIKCPCSSKLLPIQPFFLHWHLNLIVKTERHHFHEDRIFTVLFSKPHPSYPKCESIWESKIVWFPLVAHRSLAHNLVRKHKQSMELNHTLWLKCWMNTDNRNEFFQWSSSSS